MVDQLEEMLVDTSDLSLFCFYMRLFEDHFQMCLEFPAQNRYIIGECSTVWKFQDFSVIQILREIKVSEIRRTKTD